MTYVYDAANRKTSASISGRSISYSFDTAARLSSVTDNSRTISYGYDGAGNVTSIAWPGSPSLQADYTYDTLSRMTVITEHGGSALATYDYDDLSRRISLTPNNSTSTSYTYNDESTLASIAHDFAGTTYDVSFALSYNKENQITGNATTNATFRWTPSGAASDTYGAANGLNQLTTVHGSSAAYDSNGNLTTHPAVTAAMPQPAMTITNDIANRPVSTTNLATYDYDGESRRVKKTCTSGCSTVEYLYSGTTLIAEYDGSGTLLRRYVPGPGGEPVVWHEIVSGAVSSPSVPGSRRRVWRSPARWRLCSIACGSMAPTSG